MSGNGTIRVRSSVLPEAQDKRQRRPVLRRQARALEPDDAPEIIVIPRVAGRRRAALAIAPGDSGAPRAVAKRKLVTRDVRLTIPAPPTIAVAAAATRSASAAVPLAESAIPEAAAAPPAVASQPPEPREAKPAQPKSDEKRRPQSEPDAVTNSAPIAVIEPALIPEPESVADAEPSGPTVEPLAATSTDTAPQPARRRRAVRRIAAASVAAAAAAAVVIGFAYVDHSDDTQHRNRPANTAPSNAANDTHPLTSALSWLKQNVPTGGSVIVDPASASSLTIPNATVVLSTDAESLNPLAGQFVLSTPELRTAAAPAIATATPIARFGSGADEVDVLEVVSAGAVLQKDTAAARESAELQLLHNPKLHLSDSATTVLQDGRLDLRAATMLALIAQYADVTVVAIKSSDAETAAGIPARTIEIHLTDSTALTQTLESMGGNYTPASVASGPNGDRVITWPVSATAPAMTS